MTSGYRRLSGFSLFWPWELDSNSELDEFTRSSLDAKCARCSWKRVGASLNSLHLIGDKFHAAIVSVETLVPGNG